MTELEGLIRFWEDKLKSMRAYLSPTEEALIKSSIIQLKRLKKLLAEEGLDND